MKWLVRKVNDRLIRFLYNLDNEEGFMGMMLAMIMSVAIFTILSSVHIYTVNHARFQSGIKEAYIMQTDIENFATIIADAYNKGRDSCTGSGCCTADNVKFLFDGSGGCAPNVCIESSGGREYCLVKLEKVTAIASPPSVTPSSTTESDPDASTREGDLYTTCSNPPSPPSPPNPTTCATVYNHADCTNKCREATQHVYSSSHNIYTAITKCCGANKLPVINCNDTNNMPSGTCKGYETFASKKKMWCEICEKENPKEPDSEGKKARLFTYYVCPKIGGNTNDCTTKMGGTDEQKAKSGVFYQTFRVLPH